MGAYLAWYLGTFPHYQVYVLDLSQIKTICTENNIPIKVIDWDDAVGNGHCVSVINLGSEEQEGESVLHQELRFLIEELDFDSAFYEDLLVGGNSQSKVDASRNARQTHYGWTGTHSLSRDQDQMLKPQLIGGDIDSKNAGRMVTLTKIADKIYDSLEAAIVVKQHATTKARPFSNDVVNNVFAKEITEKARPFSMGDNRLHSFTVSDNRYQLGAKRTAESVTQSLKEGTFSDGKGPDVLTTIHCDVLNDQSSSGVRYNNHCVVCAWKTIQLPNGEVWCKNFIGYSRKSCYDFVNRSKMCDEYVEHFFTPWHDKLDSWRKDLFPGDDFLGPNYIPKNKRKEDEDGDGTIYFDTLLNKLLGHISGYMDAYYQVSHQPWPQLGLRTKKVMERSRTLPLCFVPFTYTQLRLNLFITSCWRPFPKS